MTQEINVKLNIINNKIDILFKSLNTNLFMTTKLQDEYLKLCKEYLEAVNLR